MTIPMVPADTNIYKLKLKKLTFMHIRDTFS